MDRVGCASDSKYKCYFYQTITSFCNKTSFEALSAVIYRPSSLEFVDQHHHQITDKSCVISALDDDLKTIKTYLPHAALKQGLSQQTRVTALADGAHNCWSVISVLEPACQTIEPILDWFHIAQKFQNLKNALGEVCCESIENAGVAESRYETIRNWNIPEFEIVN